MENINNIKKIKIATPKLYLQSLLPDPAPTNRLQTVQMPAKSSNLLNKISKKDAIYVICYDFNLKGETLVLPKGAILEFRGGTISNGTIVGNNSFISADYKIFDNIQIEGTWDCIGNVGWWASGSSTITYGSSIVPKGRQGNDDYSNIQQALDSSFTELVFPPKMFYTSNTLVLSKEKKLTLQGSAMANNIEMHKPSMFNTTIIYTDRDIDLLVINVTDNNDSPSSVIIEGGNFDVSRIINDSYQYVPYTHSCIKVKTDDYNARIWGLTINTNIFGPGSTSDSVGINLSPDLTVIKPEYNLGDYGYVTGIKIGGTISKFGTGIKAKCHYVDGRCYNWCTALNTDCDILYCKEAVNIDNVDADIKGLIQSDHIYTSDNTDALIVIDSAFSTAIGANIFDINNKVDTARYAVNIKTDGGAVQAYGKFAALCNGVSDPLCKGYTNRFYV